MPSSREELLRFAERNPLAHTASLVLPTVRAGADACERVGDGLVAAHIIARPHDEVEPALSCTNVTRRM